MLLQHEEKFNPEHIQKDILNKLGLDYSRRLYIFRSPSSLNLTSKGFELATNNLNLPFTQLNFDHRLSTDEVLNLKRLSENIYYLNPTKTHLFTTDTNVIGLYNLFSGDKSTFLSN